MLKYWTPTPGNCYQDCYTLLNEDPAFSDAVLCHGWPTLTRDTEGRVAGTVYGHAWLERVVTVGTVGGLAVQIVLAYDALYLDAPVPQDLFYQIGNIDRRYVRRYKSDEAMATALRKQHYGPWHRGPRKKKNKKT